MTRMTVEPSIFSPYWYRVAQLKPSIRNHVEFNRHHYRGELWYVIEDRSTGQCHRFTPLTYQILGLMDGKRSVQDIWEEASIKLDYDAPTQEEFIQLLSQLHALDILQCDVTPDSLEVFQRQQRQEKQRFMQKLRSPLAIKISFFDPDKLLEKMLPFVTPMFGAVGIVIWILVVGSGAVLAASHWQELTNDVVNRVLSPANLLVIWLIYPVVKTFHELGHGFAAKKWGGEVHEIGIMLLVFFPVPYVDASCASAFREKHKRIIVGFGGMGVELFIAAIALFVWLNVEPGIVSVIAYNVMFIAGVSTLLFNGNPLLKFDGYYILSDLIEIPNLATRSNQYIGYIIQRYMFGMKNAASPVTAKGEAAWFVVYSIASFVYRMIIVVSIILFVAGKYFFIGVVLAVWAAFSIFIIPIIKNISYLTSSQKVKQNRARAVLVSISFTITVVSLLFLYPAPHWTQAEGVAWFPEQSIVRAKESGFIVDVFERSGDRVTENTPLVDCEDPMLTAKARTLEARLEELESKMQEEIVSNRVSADMIKEEIQSVTEELKIARQKLSDLVIKARSAGKFIIPIPQDLLGSYIEKGAVIGYLLTDEPLTVRVVVPQARAGLVRSHTQSVELRFIDKLDETVSAFVSREVPEATTQLPSPALGTMGGGKTAVDPSSVTGENSYQEVFVFELGLSSKTPVLTLGHRAIVKFNHGTEPIAYQLYRAIRQTLLRKFNV